MKKINLKEFFGDFDATSAVVGALGGAALTGLPLLGAAAIGGKRRREAEARREEAATQEENRAREAAVQAQLQAQQQAAMDAESRLRESGHFDVYVGGVNPTTGVEWRAESGFGTPEHVNKAIAELDKHFKTQEERRLLGSSEGKIVIPGSQAVNLTATQQRQIAAERKARFEEIMERISHAERTHQGNQENLRRIAEIKSRVNQYLSFRPDTGFFPVQQNPMFGLGAQSWHEEANRAMTLMNSQPDLFPVPPAKTKEKPKRKPTNESVRAPVWFNII